MIDRIRSEITVGQRANELVTISETLQESIAHSASWAIDSEPIRARGIIIIVKYLVCDGRQKRLARLVVNDHVDRRIYRLTYGF